MTERNPPVSAYIRTLNESRLIGEVVRAAFLVADEVVVIDSGSTDRTPAIAKEAGARVIEQAWLGNGRQKRAAEEACRHDWLLDLDADEILTSALAAEIAALFADGAPAHDIYRTDLALAPPVGAPWLNFGLQKRFKLYDRRVVRQPDHEAWDQFKIPEGARVGALKEPLIHYAFDGVEGFIAKLNKHSSARAEGLPLRPDWALALRIIGGLPFYFAKKYWLQQYCRGGVYGFAIAMLSAQGRWYRDVKMWERRRREKRDDRASRLGN